MRWRWFGAAHADEQSHPPAAPVVKVLLTLVMLVVAASLVVVVLVWWGQERVVFQPPVELPLPPAGAERVEFAGSDGTPLFAYLVRESSSVDTVRSLVIHFHGNAEIAAWAVPWAQEVARRTGADVLLAEYRGYAGIPGRPTYADSREDARALWRVAQERLGAVPARATIHGFSLGSAVATELAMDVRPRALVLEAPFTSARAMAARMGPLMAGPLWRLIARVHYDTRARVATLDSRVWVAHGESDRVIPAGMGREVFAAARSKGAFLAVAQAGHNDLRGAPGYWEWLVRAMTESGEDVLSPQGPRS